jgi:hypothetical protein
MFTNFDLLGYESNYEKEKGSLVDARAYISIKAFSTVNEVRVISPECLSPVEFDAEADRLIDELQKLKIKAKHFFEKERAKQKEKV